MNELMNEYTFYDQILNLILSSLVATGKGKYCIQYSPCYLTKEKIYLNKQVLAFSEEFVLLDLCRRHLEVNNVNFSSFCFLLKQVCLLDTFFPVLKIWNVVTAGVQNDWVRVGGFNRQKKQCGLVVNVMGFRSEGLTFFPEQWR